jgi:hypothetical protein
MRVHVRLQNMGLWSVEQEGVQVGEDAGERMSLAAAEDRCHDWTLETLGAQHRRSHRHQDDIVQTHFAHDRRPLVVESRQSCEARLAWEISVVAVA